MGNGQPIDTHVHLDHQPKIEKWFRSAIKAGASDIHLKVGMAPKLRIHSKLKSTTGESMTLEQRSRLCPY